MGYLDLIREFRTETPDVQKTARAFKIAGVVCILIGIWNIGGLLMTKPGESFSIPESYAYVYLALCVVLCFVAARNIHEQHPLGKRLGKLAVVLAVAGTLGLFVVVIGPLFLKLRGMGALAIIPGVFSVVIVAQFVVPAFFFLRYLERLPVIDNPYARDQQLATTKRAEEEKSQGEEEPGAETYRASPLPFGPFGTSVVIVFGAMAIIFGAEYIMGKIAMVIVMGLAFLTILVGPAIYNFVPSPFQKTRQLIDSYICGGSTLFGSGTVPFFRLLLYRDGLEVRFMLQRYFVPYDRMEEPAEKTGFFSAGLLIKAELPGVPSSILIAGTRMKEMLGKVNELRNAYLAMSNGSAKAAPEV